MDKHIQEKLNEIMRLSDENKEKYTTSSDTHSAATDGLSAAIHSKKDAETFMAQLRAIRKRAK